MVSDSLYEFIFDKYRYAYRKHPVMTVLVSILLITFVITMSYLDEQRQKQGFEELRKQNIDFNTQLTQLESTESSLKNLLIFVQNQRNQLKDSQTRIEELKKEHEKIRPLVEADKQVIESIFLAQEQRQTENVWKERWFGFGFGILASLIASAIWYVSVQLIRRSRRTNQTLTTNGAEEITGDGRS